MWLIDLPEWRARWRDVTLTLVSTCLGAVFVAMAVVSIEYDETIAPGLSRLTEGWASTAADLTKRFAEQV